MFNLSLPSFMLEEAEHKGSKKFDKNIIRTGKKEDAKKVLSARKERAKNIWKARKATNDAKNTPRGVTSGDKANIAFNIGKKLGSDTYAAVTKNGIKKTAVNVGKATGAAAFNSVRHPIKTVKSIFNGGKFAFNKAKEINNDYASKVDDKYIEKAQARTKAIELGNHARAFGNGKNDDTDISDTVKSINNVSKTRLKNEPLKNIKILRNGNISKTTEPFKVLSDEERFAKYGKPVKAETK